MGHSYLLESPQILGWTYRQHNKDLSVRYNTTLITHIKLRSIHI